MKEKISNFIGFSLLGLCFVVSLTRILSAPDPGKERGTGGEGATIRIAHWQLENGVRSTFDKIAKEYMQLHPHIRVEQIAIPESIYTNWLVTQLVGETAPDLIQIGIGRTDERLARFFLPLTELSLQPNPYNVGTDLEGIPLRHTLFDGMEGGYNASLLEYYSVPVSGASMRVYYNLDLLREITGSDALPTTFRELVTLCEKAEAYAAAHSAPIVPIAGSKYNAPYMMNELFLSQTQKLTEKLNPPGVIGDDYLRRAEDYLDGRWTLENPEVRSGLNLLHELGKFMQPGFIQLQRDDATLAFVQRRALMISTGSWDATSIREQTAFRIGVAKVPFPSPEDPVYGQHTLGGLSEAGVNGGVLFGITRGSKQSELAKDFIRFLTSRKMNQLWTDESGWIPSVIGTRVNPDVAPFLPVSEGYLPGFLPILTDAFSDMQRLYNTNFFRLVGAKGGSEAFLSSIRPHYRSALLTDLRRHRQIALDISQRSDTQFGGLAWIAQARPGESTAQERFDSFLQSAAMNDLKFFRIKHSLEKAASETAPAR